MIQKSCEHHVCNVMVESRIRGDLYRVHPGCFSPVWGAIEMLYGHTLSLVGREGRASNVTRAIGLKAFSSIFPLVVWSR